MRIFCAGSNYSGVEERLAIGAGLRNRLLSFAKIASDAPSTFWFDRAQRPDGSRLFLDSGAYSVRTRGVEIDIGRYCDFIEANRHAIDQYANLDVIGDWRLSARNLRFMRARGLDPLPVFHRDSPWRELERLAAENGRVALGGLQVSNFGGLSPFFRAAFKHLYRYWPVRVHMFGVTMQSMLEQYPFYSADSGTAIAVVGKYGRVLHFENGSLVSRGWPAAVHATGDLSIADHLGPALGRNGSAFITRRIRSVAAMMQLERHVTELWRRHGVAWE